MASFGIEWRKLIDDKRRKHINIKQTELVGIKWRTLIWVKIRHLNIYHPKNCKSI